MQDFKKVLSKTKTQLKAMITKESSQEQINAITSVDKVLDSLNEAYQGKEEEVNSLKDNLIDMVKNTGFKVDGSKGDEDIDGNQKSMEEIMQEELNKITAKQNQ